IELHQAGEIPAGTYVVDLDAVSHNAALLAEEARRWSLRTYAMTKSYGRNPLVTAHALACGLDTTVSVEAREAHIIARYGLPIGHVGHIGAIPVREAASIIAYQPERVTVFTVRAAEAVSDAARAAERVQDLYVRVNCEGDEIFPGFIG